MTAIPSAPASPQPDLSALPRRSDRRTGAKLVEQYYFPVTPRTLEVWPLDWVLVNGKAVCETAELFAVAQAKLDAAPPIRSVRRRMPAAAADLQPAE
jgi:hypothetical protein